MNPEKEINLTVLQQRDPYITSISDSASQVAIYSFNSDNNEWEKTNVEGTLFVYNRSACPFNGFIVINRLDPRDLIEPIDKNLEFQLQDHFLLYRNAKGNIIGIWFYDENECIKISKLLNSLVKNSIRHLQQSEVSRPRGSSESEAIVDRVDPSTTCPDANIMNLLFKAQNEYEKVKCQISLKKTNPFQTNSNNWDSKDANSWPNPTQINLESLFKRVSMQQDDTKLNQNSQKLKNNQEITQQVSVNESSKNSVTNKNSTKTKTSNQSHFSQGGFPSKNSFPKINSSCSNVNEVEKSLRTNSNQVEAVNEGTSRTITSQLPTHISTASNIMQPRKCSPSTVIQQLTHNQSTHNALNKFQAINSTPTTAANLLKENADQENRRLKPIMCSSQEISDSNGPMENDREKQKPIVSQSSISGGLKSETLLNGPDKYSSSSIVNDSLVSSNVLLSPMVFQSLPANKKTANVSPNLDEDRNKLDVLTENPNESITPLTKQQFQLALLNLIKNDSNFLNRLHDAYISCLNLQYHQTN